MEPSRYTASYDGTTDPAEFKRQFRIQALVKGLDEETQLGIIEHCLTGRAKAVFDAIPVEDRTLERIFNGLQTQCAPGPEIYLTQFFARKPKPGESILVFAQALKDLISKGMPALNQAQQLPILRAQLATHLPETLRAVIAFLPDLT